MSPPLTRGGREGLVLVVPKEKIAANGDFNLSGARYRESGSRTAKYPHKRLEEICEVNPKQADPAELFDGWFNYIDISSIENESGKFLGANRLDVREAPSRARRIIASGDVLLSTVRPNLKAFSILFEIPERAIASTGFAVLRSKPDECSRNF